MEPRLGHINIVADDIPAMADFFVRNFNYTAGKLTKVSASWVSILTRLPDASAEFMPLTAQPGCVNIELLTYIHPASPPQSSGSAVPNIQGYRHIGFEVEDIAAKTADLEGQGFEFLSMPQYVKEMNVKTVYFIGPEGILIQLTERE